MLLLNTVLTVRDGCANSHKGQGWEGFTAAVISAVNAKPESVAFVLWGKPASRLATQIAERHVVVTSSHPSPLSARRGIRPFIGSRPFSEVDAKLKSLGRGTVGWTLS